MRSLFYIGRFIVLKLSISILLAFIIQININAQVSLERIGQTPGGAGYHVNYDSLSQRMFVGAGTSLWVYDFSDPETPIIIGKRPFLGLITESILFDSDVLFVSATFDGIYAIDLSSEDLSVIDHKHLDGFTKRAAYDMALVGDTLLIPTNGRVARLKYTHPAGFSTLPDVGPNILQGNAFCIAERGDYIVVGAQRLFNGRVYIYRKSDLNSPIAYWQDSTITGVSKLRFSDLNDNIIYVCGGTSNAGFSSSFHAIKLEGANVMGLDSYSIAGVPYLAAANIQNIDARNDTLYVATGSAVDVSRGLPLTYIPIFDATGLPQEPMEMIDYINPGLWHFDVALMHGTPYMATASEWLGIAVNNVKSGIPLDTLMLLSTGGWTHKSKVKGDTLWVAHEGWGLAAYNIDSLMFSNGYMTDSKLLHLYEQEGPEHFFVGDFEFLNDTLLLMDNGTVYNLKPWHEGGRVELLYKTNFSGYVRSASTNLGQRIVCGTQSIILPDLGDTQKLSIYDPFDPSGNALYTKNVFNNVLSITCIEDIVFYGYRPDVQNQTKYLAASKIIDDKLVLIDSIATEGQNHINSISIDNNIVAVGKGNTVSWYSWDGSNFTFISSYFDFQMVELDIILRDNFIYIADRVKGLLVIDITDSDNPLAATFEGRGTWKNLFGSQSISLDDEGRIYLSDFNAGVIIIEALNNTSSMPDKPLIHSEVGVPVVIYPNPSSSHIQLEFSNPDGESYSLNIRNSSGLLMKSISKVTDERLSIDLRNFKSGVYFLDLSDKHC